MAFNENLPSDTKDKKRHSAPRAFAALLLRLWLGFSAIGSGLAKFATAEKVFEENPETGEMTARIVRTYSPDFYNGIPAREFERLLGDTLFPEWILQAFYYAVGPALILLGSALVIGFATRTSLFLLGLIFVALTFGLSLIDSSGTPGTLGIYLLAIVAALLLGDSDRFRVLRKF